MNHSPINFSYLPDKHRHFAGSKANATWEVSYRKKERKERRKGEREGKKKIMSANRVQVLEGAHIPYTSVALK